MPSVLSARGKREAGLRGFKAALIVLWLIGGALILVFAFPALARIAPARIPIFKTTWFRGLARLLGLKVQCRGALASAPAMLVSNHISWLDVVVLGTLGPLTFVAKQEVAEWPLIGYLARRSGTMFVSRLSLRSSNRLVENLESHLRMGERVALFPEGTTSNGESLLPFRCAGFQAAVDAGAVVQPVALQYHGEPSAQVPFVGRDAFVPHLWRLLWCRQIVATLQLCKPLESRGASRSELANRSHRAIRDVLRETIINPAEEKSLDRVA